jgi:hypothetical protein
MPLNERRLPPLPVTVQKEHENREDLEEKYGKFSLPQPSLAARERHRDETHSVISDAWSTDVVASDNEQGDGHATPMMHPPGGMVFVCVLLCRATKRGGHNIDYPN